VTFINNAGFLLTVGDKKVLIDALYDTHNERTTPPQEVLQRGVNAEPPFDQVDLIIATHSHTDHFSATLVGGHLQNNPEAAFVSSQDAVSRLNRAGYDFSERVVGVDLGPGESTRLSINGIELECLYLTHGDDSILNIAFVITIDDYTFFHSGDISIDPEMGDAVSLADLQGYGLPQKDIDLAMLTSFIFLLEEDRPLIEEGIQARFVSPMHYPYQYPPQGIEEDYPNAVVFRDLLESWVVPPE
jgi:L-ascorbate metabolism protein UlaG (beta-lactamase superfamily)